jgi:RimJ/RimL family protein N-acetyltransferase
MEVRLRAFRPDDLPILYAHQADPVANEMAHFPARDEEALAAHWAKITADPENVTAVAEADGEVVGNIGSWPDEGRRYVGYWVGRAWWGRGIATEMLRAFLAQIPDRPLHAYVAVGNVGSQRVLEKNGFVPVERDGVEILFELT